MSMLCVACAEDPTGRCGMHKARGVDEEVRPLGPGAGKFSDRREPEEPRDRG